MLVPSLFEKLELRKEIQLLDDNTDKSSQVMLILSTKFRIIDITIGEADTIYRYFFDSELDFEKFNTIFK